MATSSSSAALTALKSTPEKRNFLLLTRLAIAGGTQLLHEVFDGIHPPHTLATVLSYPASTGKLKRPYVTKPQYDILYPAPGTYGKSADFDITLLFKLFREICGLTAPPVTGWDKLPTATDTSQEADLARLKFYRNSIYGHTRTMEVTDGDFNVLWQEIKEAMLRLAKGISPAKEMEWENAIDKLLRDPLTPEDEDNVAELKSWYLSDMETKESLDHIQSVIEDTSLQVTEVKSAVTRSENKTDDILKSSETLKSAVEDTSYQVANVQSSVNKMQKNLEEVKSAVLGGENKQSPAARMSAVPVNATSPSPCNKPSTSETQAAFTERQVTLPVEISNCESDIKLFAKFYDQATRQWLLKSFQAWFDSSSDLESRAFIFLGDAGIGKSVMAAVLAQRMQAEHRLGAAFFCRHNDSTRCNPRYLLSSIAYQLCNTNLQYCRIVGGCDGIEKFISTNRELGVHELFTKLLEEPLSQCKPPAQRQLVVIDALDESQYEGHSDLLDLIVQKFPMLPPWVVFFITSRPEEQIQFMFEDFKPCIRICSGDGQQTDDFHQHCQDLEAFLRNKLGTIFPGHVTKFEEHIKLLLKKCEGLFLYAHHITEQMQTLHSSEPRSMAHLYPKGIREFYRKNFKRIRNILGEKCFKELIGCAVVSPGPLPTSFVSVILRKSDFHLSEQKVLDTISTFFPIRSNEGTFSFLHSLIPSWLTDKKEARECFIDRRAAIDSLSEFMTTVLRGFTNSSTSLSEEKSITNYVLRYGVRFLCEVGTGDIARSLYECLTNLAFAEAKLNVSRSMVYSLIDDYRVTAETMKTKLTAEQIQILEHIGEHILDDALLFSTFPHLVSHCFARVNSQVRQNIPGSRLDLCSMETKQYLPNCNVLSFAFSADRSLMACLVQGKGAQVIVIINVAAVKEISNVVIPFICFNCRPCFSPDNRFVFLGRLDKWYSVDEGSFVDMPQFSSNKFEYCYASASFILDGQFILVDRGITSLVDFGNKHYCRVCSFILLYISYSSELHAMSFCKDSFDNLRRIYTVNECGLDSGDAFAPVYAIMLGLLAQLENAVSTGSTFIPDKREIVVYFMKAFRFMAKVAI